ncbi:hypothetical protein PTTG_25086, partial [Puccinia triticina 1-1 BBBD Race 1]
ITTTSRSPVRKAPFPVSRPPPSTHGPSISCLTTCSINSYSPRAQNNSSPGPTAPPLSSPQRRECPLLTNLAYTFALFDRYACSLSPLPAGFTSTDVSLHQRNILPDPSLFEDDQAHGSLSLVSFVVPPQPDAKLCVEKGTHRT